MFVLSCTAEEAPCCSAVATRNALNLQVLCNTVQCTLCSAANHASMTATDQTECSPDAVGAPFTATSSSAFVRLSWKPYHHSTLSAVCCFFMCNAGEAVPRRQSPPNGWLATSQPTGRHYFQAQHAMSSLIGRVPSAVGMQRPAASWQLSGHSKGHPSHYTADWGDAALLGMLHITLCCSTGIKTFG